MTTRGTACSRQNAASSAMPAVSLLKLASRCPGSMQTSSLAFETSTPQIVFFTVTCLVHAIGTQATVRSCVTWRRSQSSPAVVAERVTGDIATRFGRWPPAKALSRFHRTNPGRADTRGNRSPDGAKRNPGTARQRMKNPGLRYAPSGLRDRLRAHNRLQIIIRLDDLDQTILGGAVAAIGVGMVLLDQRLVLGLDVLKGGFGGESHHLQRLALGVHHLAGFGLGLGARSRPPAAAAVELGEHAER